MMRHLPPGSLDPKARKDHLAHGAVSSLGVCSDNGITLWLVYMGVDA
jgi:hypothetical protein